MSAELKGSAYKEKWVFNYKNSSKASFSFFYGGRELFESEGVTLGVIKETSGLTRSVRPHFSVKTNDCSVDSETLLPFGSEPRIKRKCEQTANHFRITTDISIPSRIAVDSVAVDSLKIKGQWKEIDIYAQKSAGSLEIIKETVNSEDIDSKGLSFASLPLAIVLKDGSGIELEIGAGYDLWRWANAPRFQAVSSFTLKKTKDGLFFERKPLRWKEDHEISKFNFRYTWYFAWIKVSDEEKPSTTRKKPEVLEIRNNKLIPANDTYSSIANVILSEQWPESSSSSQSCRPCFASRQTENLLKDFIRSTLSNNVKEREKNLTIREIEPHICLKANHLERSKDEGFAHWDYFYMMAFYEWANRFLSGADKKFHLALSKDSILSNLPSGKGLEL